MGANELKLEPMQEKTNLQDFDEAEETLSLCDIVIDGYETDWEGYSKEEQSSSFDQDFFEFISEDFTDSAIYPSNDIIFCGKLITYKEPLVPEKTTTPKTTNKQQKTKKSNIFSWKSNSFSKSGTTSLSKAPPQQEKRYKKTLSMPVSEKYSYNTRKCNDHFEFSDKKVSIMAAPVKSSRWYLFAFGMGRFPMEMELRDIKTRQSKRSPATMFRSDGDKEKVKGSGRRSGNGLWGLLRVLSCKSQRANAMVKASFGCMPHV